MPIASPYTSPGPHTPQQEAEPAPRRPDECEHEHEYERECARADARDSTAPPPPNEAKPRPTAQQRSPRGRKRIARQARFYAERLRSAHTPTERVAIAWERWRSLIRHHDPADADHLAEKVFAVIDEQIAAMTPDHDPQLADQISDGGGPT